MNTFRLLIQTMDGQVLDDQVQRLVCRTIEGDVAIMAGHCNYCTAVGMGRAHVVMADGSKRIGACIGGMVSMYENECHLLPTSWEWADQIDESRAMEAKRLAEHQLAKSGLSEEEQKKEKARLQRAEVRLAVAALASPKRKEL